jgi:hypothetical protein
MGVVAVAVMGAVGLAADVGRVFIVKNETQNYCDSAALAAALALDGTTTGITNATTAVTNTTDKWNLNTQSVSSPTVTFAKATAGPFVASPNPATGYLYVKVSTSVSLPLYFIPVMVGQISQTVAAQAIAGQIDITSFPQGLAPYSGVSTNTTGPTFGLTVGNSYDIQWPNYNGGGGCNPGNPDKCFVKPPCSGDSKAAENAVVNNWASSISGYWGASSNSTIEQEILDVIQLTPVSVGDNLFPVLTNGNKASEANYLDERASEDTDTSDNTVATYLAATHNGRRLLPVPILDPVDPTHTTVIGYGVYLLLSNGSPSNYYQKTANGNDPFCAIYAGPYNLGSSGAGGGGSTGASVVKLVQ